MYRRRVSCFLPRCGAGEHARRSCAFSSRCCRRARVHTVLGSGFSKEASQCTTQKSNCNQCDATSHTFVSFDASAELLFAFFLVSVLPLHSRSIARFLTLLLFLCFFSTFKQQRCRRRLVWRRQVALTHHKGWLVFGATCR